MTDQTPETDISTAFEDLRREVSLTRAAVEGLTAARERIPDYGPTLNKMIEALNATSATAVRIEKSPAVSLSPDAMTAQIVKAGSTARSEDVRIIREAASALASGCGQIDLMIKRGQAVERRAWWNRRELGAAFLAGILLWSILPGALARSMPADWAMPERLAAGMVNADRWTAGGRMMASADPASYKRIVDAARVTASSAPGQASPKGDSTVSTVAQFAARRGRNTARAQPNPR